MQTQSKLASVPLFQVVKWWQALNMLVVSADRLGSALLNQAQAPETRDFLRYMQQSGLINALKHCTADLRFFVVQQLPSVLDQPAPDYQDLLELLSQDLGYFWNEHPAPEPLPNHALIPLYKLVQWWQPLTMLAAAFEQGVDHAEPDSQAFHDQSLIDYLTQSGLFLACGQIRSDLNSLLAQHDLSVIDRYELKYDGLFGQLAARFGYFWQAPQ
ncbi:hypothetical protein [Herpetosiphon sp. NSE202]|uniref:hypothetical protein n=1 Tax=Herpetosiphon sp. NSE202 TaxID=3351349 RepID=UPI00362C17D8